MALDHYVSQVHLKNFYSEDLENKMYAYRKADLKLFTPNAKSVCRIDEGSTNEYLEDSRAIEKFLKEIEPKYNAAVDKIKNKNIDRETIYTISGFLSYIITCSPAAMRIHSELFRGLVEDQAITLDSAKQIPPPPPELGADSMTELLKSGKLKIDIDGKYPQAHGINSILYHVSVFGNSTWDILENPHIENPFFSSDFPVAIEQGSDSKALNRILPLTPQIAIRIKPNTNPNRETLNHEFDQLKYRYKRLSLTEVKSLNRLLVQCAESIVFSCQDNDWTEQFIRKNSNFRIEPIMARTKTKNGSILYFTQEIRKTKK